MRRLAGIVALGLAVETGIGIGCGAAGEDGTTSGGGGSGEPSGPGPGHGSVASTTGSSMTGGGGGSGPTCAKFTAEAKQLPAAMLTVLDMSASMNKAQKWGTAQLAVVSAIDKDVFDSMSLGLITFPSGFTQPPQCLCDSICAPLGGCSIQECTQYIQLSTGAAGVSCGVSFLPQVALSPAGKEKSADQTGVRSKIYNYLVANKPLSNADDGSPIYDALTAAYAALKAYPIDQRIAVLITDGGFSCTSVSSNPVRLGYADANNCPDWEIPDTVNQLITGARTDPAKPIFTFIVGVPGSNSTGSPVDGFDTPPYKMRLALSTYAVSGSPDTVDPACDKAVYTKDGAEPAVPCHNDLSNGASFDTDALASAIAGIRGKALGCVYDLPDPPPGEMIDPTLVNVDLTVDGTTTTIKKRSMPNDQCMDDACWDYNPKGQVEIIGKGCADLSTAKEAKVEIFVGCDTIIK